MEYFSDEDLVRLYVNTQSSNYFELIYKRYCREVHRKCLLFTQDEAQAEDLTQDIFLKLISRLNTYKQQAKFSTWLYKIVRNHCTDHARIVRVKQETINDDNWDRIAFSISDSGPSDEKDKTEWLISQAMMILKTEEQGLLRMKYIDGVSIREIADQFATTPSAVKMRLKRSRDRFRQLYYELLFNDIIQIPYSNS